MLVKLEIKVFFDLDIYMISYVVWDVVMNVVVIIDFVLNYDLVFGCIQFCFVDELIWFVEDNFLIVEWILEIYVYVDYFFVVFYFYDCLGGMIGIGEYVKYVQGVFGDLFNVEDGFQCDGL